MAEESGQNGAELKARLAEVGRLSALRADLGKRKALVWLTENVELIDEDGAPVDRADLEFPAQGVDGDSDDQPQDEQAQDEQAQAVNKTDEDG